MSYLVVNQESTSGQCAVGIMLASHCSKVGCRWTPEYDVLNFVRSLSQLLSSGLPSSGQTLRQTSPNFAPNFKTSYSGAHRESISGQCDAALREYTFSSSRFGL